MTKPIAGATQAKSLTTWDYIWVSAVLAGLAWSAVQAVRWIVHRAEVVPARQSRGAPAATMASLDAAARLTAMNARSRAR